MLGFAYAEIAGEPYWDETACWEFTAAGIDTLETVTGKLECLARLAADDAVWCDRHAKLGIPEAVWPLVVASGRASVPLRPHGPKLGRHFAAEAVGVQRRHADFAV